MLVATALESADEPALTDNARTVLERRYLLRENGVLRETAGGLLTRVTDALAKAETKYGADASGFASALRAHLQRLEMLPNSPTLMNAGKPGGQLAACFVLPVEDHLNGIFDAVKWAALIQQTGGGTGFSFSRLRPSGDRVGLREGAAGGPIPFIEVFDAATNAIKQGGVRRGANMAVLRVDHPDVLQFIAAKSDLQRLTNFNVSVAVTDEFMQALERGESYALYNPRSREVLRRLEARTVWSLISTMAWQSGEPGVLFIDRINAANPTPALGEMEATNPCGELPLLPFEACNLGSIDVGKFVSKDGRDFDWPRLRQAAHLAVRMLDDVIEVNQLSAAADRSDDARQSQGRRGRDGPRRRFHSSRPRLRLGGRGHARREARCLLAGRDHPRVGKARRGTRSVSPLGRLALATRGRAAASQRDHHDHRTDGNHQHSRRLLGRDRASVRGLRSYARCWKARA